MLERVFHEPKFRVCCLGGLKLVETGSGTDATPASRKTRALIGYLCVAGKPVGRERLASLLWSDRGDEQARASLRQALYELRSLPGGGRLLKTERETVAVGEDVRTDIAAIAEAGKAGNLEQLGHALSEWRGELFDDLAPIDPNFDAWLQAERLRVQESLIEAAIDAVKAGMAKGEIDPARKIVGLLQQRDGANEVVLRIGLRLDRLAGDSAALHRRYERFRELLKTELDAAPAAETQRLFHELAAESSASANGSASGGTGADGVKEAAQGSVPIDATVSAPPPRVQPATATPAPTQILRWPLFSGRLLWPSAVVLAVASLCALIWAVSIARVPALPHGVATQIADAFGKVFTSGSPAQPRQARSAGFDHYVQGRRLFALGFANAAATEFEASVRLAPNSANAWSALAAARWRLARDTLADHRENYDPAMRTSARAAAGRALALDPNNAEALGVLALLIPATRLQDIDRLLERSLRSQPDNPQLLAWHAEFLMFVGRNHEAWTELTRAYVLDRTTPSIAPNLVLASLKAGRLADARDMIDLIGRGRDGRLHGELYLLHVKYYLYRRDWFGLATYLRTSRGNFSPRVDGLLRLCRDTAIALATHQSGRFGWLRATWRTEASIDPDDTVQFLAALGDADGALATVQSAVNSRRNDELLTDPEWEALFVPDLLALRRDPRVPALFAQWGLSDYWRAANHLPDFMR